MNQEIRDMIQEKVQENIDRVGLHIFGIFDPDRIKPAFYYTIGNHLKGLPEFLLIGDFMPPQMAASVINVVSAIQTTNGEAIPEGLLDIDYTMPVKIRAVSDEAKVKYSVQAGQLLGTEDYKLLQIMIPDVNQRFPGDEGCDPKFNVDQP